MSKPSAPAMTAAGVREAMIQYQKAMEAGSKEVLMVKVATPKEGDQTVNALKDKFPAAQFKVMQQDDVGPQVGSDLKTERHVGHGAGACRDGRLHRHQV